MLEDEMLKTPKSNNFKESLYDTLKRTNLIQKNIFILKNTAKKRVDYLCTPFHSNQPIY